jgi:hypothetical protein
LSIHREVFTVQKKLDCPVSETGLYGFHGYNPWTELTLSSHLSLLPLLFSSFNREGNPKTPIGDFLIPPWNLGALG